MIRPEMTKAIGPMTEAPGILYGRSASGSILRNAPRDSGAPAYISTLAEVTSPTSACQLGNGSRKTRPNRNEMTRPNQGMPFLSVLVNMEGKYRFLARP